MLRRLEDRGEVRGGRFVSGFGGEQFALPEVLESLRSTRNQELKGDVAITGADPVNLVGILVSGERVPAVPGRIFSINNELLAGTGPSLSRHRELSKPRSAAQTSSARGSDVERPSLFKASLFGQQGA